MVCHKKLKHGHMAWCSPKCYGIYHEWKRQEGSEKIKNPHEYYLAQRPETKPQEEGVYHGGR